MDKFKSFSFGFIFIVIGFIAGISIFLGAALLEGAKISNRGVRWE